jgi:hypothetical protein
MYYTPDPVGRMWWNGMHIAESGHLRGVGLSVVSKFGELIQVTKIFEKYSFNLIKQPLHTNWLSKLIETCNLSQTEIMCV